MSSLYAMRADGKNENEAICFNIIKNRRMSPPVPCVSTDLSFFYISFFNHASYHLLTALFRKIGIGVKGVYRRRVGYSRQHGALVIAELIRSFAEIAHDRLIYAIVYRTELNVVVL